MRRVNVSRDAIHKFPHDNSRPRSMRRRGMRTQLFLFRMRVSNARAIRVGHAATRIAKRETASHGGSRKLAPCSVNCRYVAAGIAVKSDSSFSQARPLKSRGLARTNRSRCLIHLRPARLQRLSPSRRSRLVLPLVFPSLQLHFPRETPSAPSLRRCSLQPTKANER